VTQPVVAESTPAPASTPNPNRRALIFLGVVLAVAALFVLVIRPLVFGGDDEGAVDEAATSTPVTRPPLMPSTTTTTMAAPGESFEVFGSKNPFLPPSGAQTPAQADDAPDGGQPLGRGSSATTTTAAPGDGVQATGDGTTPRPAQRVALVDVYDSEGRKLADARVNSTMYTRLAPGEQFAGNYRVVSLDGDCGTFLVGEDQLRLCKGEEVLK
jgi:hypothetical protein